MAKKQASFRVELARARALWSAKQGLSPRLGGSAAEVVARTGWVRTLGGVDVYLSVRARCPDLRRTGLDDAVAAGRVRVTPAARGCIYLVPDRDVPMALSLAASLWRPRTDRDLAKAGSSWQEVEGLAGAVIDVLAGSSSASGLTTAAIRKVLPDGAVRSFGPAGKKIGLSSPLPVALRLLEFSGRIERTLEDGRLDTERYFWRVARDGAAKDAIAAQDSDPDSRNAAVARHFLTVAGPATLKQFATWSGLSQRDAKAAVAAVGGVPVSIDGGQGAADAWLLESDVDALQNAAVPAPTMAPTVAFLPFEDNLITTHGGPAVHVDPAHHDLPVAKWGRTAKSLTLGTVRHIGHRTVVAGDRVIGFWEFDIASGAVICVPFAPVTGVLKRALEAEKTAISAFLRDDVGHARSFSLDTDAAVQKRASAIREALPDSAPSSRSRPGSNPGSPRAMRSNARPVAKPKLVRRTGGKKTISRRG